MKFTTLIFAAILLFSIPTPHAGAAKDKYKVEDKQAIVLAVFGTTVESGLKGLFNIRERLENKFPETPVRFAFTSNIIRRIWQKRAKDPQYLAANPHIPDDIIHVQGPLATIANLQDAGYNMIVVQPTHITPAEEFFDLCSYVEALDSIDTIKAKYKPFKRLTVGRPALGNFGVKHPYAKDIIAAAEALADDAELARKEKAALVYMGHGNEHYPSGGAYLELAARMRQLYPDTHTYIGSVEGYPSFDDMFEKLAKSGIKKVLLKPFMVVAGDHAKNDMVGPTPDSWKSKLEKLGIEVVPIMRGLGEEEKFAEIFVRNAAEAAEDAGIILK